MSERWIQYRYQKHTSITCTPKTQQSDRGNKNMRLYLGGQTVSYYIKLAVDNKLPLSHSRTNAVSAVFRSKSKVHLVTNQLAYHSSRINIHKMLRRRPKLYSLSFSAPQRKCLGSERERANFPKMYKHTRGFVMIFRQAMTTKVSEWVQECAKQTCRGGIQS